MWHESTHDYVSIFHVYVCGNLSYEIHLQKLFQIIVEGIRGSNALSDIAWDDITIVHGKCGAISVMPEPEVPLPTSADLSVTTPGKVSIKPVLIH